MDIFDMENKETKKYWEFRNKHYQGYTNLEINIYARGIDVIDDGEEKIKKVLVGRANDKRTLDMVLDYLTARIIPGCKDQDGSIYSANFRGQAQTIQYMSFLEKTQDCLDRWLNLNEACRSINSRRKLLRAMTKSKIRSIAIAHRKEIAIALEDYRKAEECAKPENVERVQRILKHYEDLREAREAESNRNYGGGPW